MRIVLRDPAVSTGDLVRFTVAGGWAIATWEGENPHPAGVEVDVELDLPDEVDWNRIVVGPMDGRIVELRESGLVLRGVVVDLDELGVLSLSVGTGVVMVDTLGEPPLGVVGQTVALPVDRLAVYPTGI